MSSLRELSLSNLYATKPFWSAFVLTRPLGVVVGDFLDKPIASRGLDLSRYTASIVLLVAIFICIYIAHRKSPKLNKVY